MAIIFECIEPGNEQTISIDRETSGKYYEAKLSAAVNSSNLGVNSDRGQDFGWRLQPEQQAIIEEWESDGEMVDEVSKHTGVAVDTLNHVNFLEHLLYEQEKGYSPEKSKVSQKRKSQADYEARVEAIKTQKTPEAVPAFEAPKPTAKK